MAHGGDQLARGARSATFGGASGDVTEAKWNEAFPGAEDAFEERLRKKREQEELEAKTGPAPEVVEEKQKVEEVQRVVVERKKYIEGQQVPFRAVLDRVVVARIEESEIENGLYKPQEFQEKPAEGIVVAVGPGKYVNGQFVPTTTVVGERVLFGKFSGALVIVGYQEFLVLREEDIFLVKQ